MAESEAAAWITGCQVARKLASTLTLCNVFARATATSEMIALVQPLPSGRRYELRFVRRSDEPERVVLVLMPSRTALTRESFDGPMPAPDLRWLRQVLQASRGSRDVLVISTTRAST
jgi:hypothetical protein